MSNILIADPSQKMRRTLADNVRGFGHNIFEAETGAAAVQVLSGKKIQVLFLDVEILERDESDVLVQAKKVSPSTSVLVVLGLGEDGKKWTSAGAFAAVTKPFNIQALRRIITEAVQNSKAYVPGPAAGAAPPPRGRVAKKAWISAAVAAALLAGGAGAYFFSQRSPRAQVYTVPFENLSSVAVLPDGIWLCDWFEQAIVRYPAEGAWSMRQKVETPALHPSALAWDGKNLWSYASWEKRLVKHRAADYRPGEEFPLPDGLEIGAFCFGKGAFWLYDSKSSRIGKLGIENAAAQVQEWYASISGSKVVGIYWEGERLWSADESGRIYEQSVGANLSLEKVYQVPAEIRAQGKLAFFIKDGKTCWAGLQGSKTVVSFPWKSVNAYEN